MCGGHSSYLRELPEIPRNTKGGNQVIATASYGWHLPTTDHGSSYARSILGSAEHGTDEAQDIVDIVVLLQVTINLLPLCAIGFEPPANMVFFGISSYIFMNPNTADIVLR